MRILYMTWGERPEIAGVYGGQVVDLVHHLQEHPKIEQIKLLVGAPVIYRGMRHGKYKFRMERDKIRALLGEETLIARRTVTAPVGVFARKRDLPFFAFGHIRWGCQMIRQMQPDIVHCRSYVATHMAHRLRDAGGFDFKIVFDPRGFMPEEAIVSGSFADGSPDYHFWKEEEKRLSQRSDAVITVSETMRLDFEAMGGQNVTTIYLNAPIDDNASDAVDRLQKDGVTLCYCGGLSGQTWHHPDRLWQLFGALKDRLPGSKLKVVTRTDHDGLRKDFLKHFSGQFGDDLTLAQAASPAEVVRLMQSADLGALSSFTPSAKADEKVAYSIFGTKSAEYLAAGLPVLVNSVCGGAAIFVKEHKAGLVYDADAPLEGVSAEDLLALTGKKQEMRTLARTYFGLENNAQRLVDLYQKLLSK